jgi:hypothetical protein
MLIRVRGFLKAIERRAAPIVTAYGPLGDDDRFLAQREDLALIVKENSAARGVSSLGADPIKSQHVRLVLAESLVSRNPGTTISRSSPSCFQPNGTNITN